MAVLPVALTVKGDKFAATDPMVVDTTVTAEDAYRDFFDVNFDETNNTVSFAIKDEHRADVVKGKTYALTMKSNVLNLDNEETTSNKVKVSIKILDAAPVPTVDASGSFNTVRRNAGITYTYKNSTNIYSASTKVVSLAIENLDAAKFEIDSQGYDAKGVNYVALITPKNNETFNVKTKYGYDLVYTIAPVKTDGTPDMDRTYTVRKTIKNLAITQSALKYQVSGTTIYQAAQHKTGEFTVKLTSPADASIDSLVEKSIPAQVSRALSFNNIRYNLDGTATIEYTIINPAALKAGAKYTLKYDLTPMGNDDTNYKKPTEVSFSITINK
ncbi:MAG: hypothetical protein HUJ70_12330 [Pseudobutyrivibrio sp.]|nr:hypothetical protein [Pseudobutyrivibrio sp.]